MTAGIGEPLAGSNVVGTLATLHSARQASSRNLTHSPPICALQHSLAMAYPIQPAAAYISPCSVPCIISGANATPTPAPPAPAPMAACRPDLHLYLKRSVTKRAIHLHPPPDAPLCPPHPAAVTVTGRAAKGQRRSAPSPLTHPACNAISHLPVLAAVNDACCVRREACHASLDLVLGTLPPRTGTRMLTCRCTRACQTDSKSHRPGS
jgi:hypothetical protein